MLSYQFNHHNKRRHRLYTNYHLQLQLSNNQSNRDETIIKATVNTTQPTYDSQQETKQECDRLGLSKSGFVTMNTRNNQGFARSPKHRDTGGQPYQQ
jgi:hypothetical protein